MSFVGEGYASAPIFEGGAIRLRVHSGCGVESPWSRWVVRDLAEPQERKGAPIRALRVPRMSALQHHRYLALSLFAVTIAQYGCSSDSKSPNAPDACAPTCKIGANAGAPTAAGGSGGRSTSGSTSSGSGGSPPFAGAGAGATPTDSGTRSTG